MKKVLIAGVAAVAMAGAAQAVTVTSTAYDVTPGNGETVILDFESMTLPAGYTLTSTNSGYFTGSSAVAAAPFNDNTQYFAVQANGSATLSIAKPWKSLSLYIGSVDTYNTVTIGLTNGQFQSFSGTGLTTTANGDRDSGLTNRRYFFTAVGNERINSINFTSARNSFEFDNLAAAAVPEPASWAMMIGGLAMVGAAKRRRRSTTSVAF